jgi:hypothetical protein
MARRCDPRTLRNARSGHRRGRADHPGGGADARVTGAVAFAVAIVTLVVQGLLLAPVVRRLHPADDVDGNERTEILELRKRMKEAGDTAVAAAVAGSEASIGPIVVDEVAQYQRLRRVQLDAERAVLRDAYERGAFSTESIDVMRTALDSEEISLDAANGRNGG